MEQRCRVSGRSFLVEDEELDFLEKLSPVVGGVKLFLPAPALCPQERRRRRLAFRNERNLYHRTCALTGKPIISSISPDKDAVVYAKEAWWSDSWDARSYGREMDFSRPFFEQVAELKRAVPHMALITGPDSDQNNCRYVNFAGSSRNCYMTFDSDFNEDSCYANVLKHSKNCLDCSYVRGSQWCYECVDCHDCYGLSLSQDCVGCSESYFLHNCIGCNECFMCANLTQKRYYIENKPFSREEYARQISTLGLHNRDRLERLAADFRLYVQRYPKKYAHVMKIENCSGDYLLNAKNCFYCFNIAECEDLRFCDSLYNAKMCMDVSSFGEQIEWVYNSGTIGLSSSNIFMCHIAAVNCSNLIYCVDCRTSQNLFGCCSMRRSEYCVLNKQYSREEYEELVPRIVAHMRDTGEWGEYFPLYMSSYGYNETVAQEFFPLSKEEAATRGARWSEYQPPPPNVSVIAAASLPGDISQVSDKVLENAVQSSTFARPFRIAKAELEFYRQRNLPLPARHPDERHARRMAQRTPPQLWKRSCAKTGKTVYSSYAPSRPEAIYCQEAFEELME
jgi:hypothetical protein